MGPSAASSVPAGVAQSPPLAAPGSISKIRLLTSRQTVSSHEWYQNDHSVMVSIFAKGVAKDSVEIGMGQLSVSFPLPSGSFFSLELDPLAHEIEPSSSTFEVLSTKIELKLKKKMSGLKWGALEGDDDLLSGGYAKPSGTAPSYPSSAKSRKDWDKLEKEVDSDKPEGDAALNALFQSIYRDATDDTRRAMMKSFVESNGTCLSTNWDEVGKKKVECSPPEGMEARAVGVRPYAFCLKRLPFVCVFIVKRLEGGWGEGGRLHL
ncbi:MAG: SGS domain-containing protein [Olpidium bornovanus]|uniref:SGS domain-containing protein n=1 Tax=Olpidium bornovanus TaxID=278681 RepID=A0A8H7ZP54_9FUNG|nr:MAG: SGS domain-containing protein [Olpidium bornovanus]